MKLTNRHNLPAFVVSMLTHDSYDSGGASRTISQLIDSPRIQILREENQDDIERDAADYVFSRFGTGMHSMFEDVMQKGKLYNNFIPEERLLYKSHGWNIGGKPDVQEETPDGYRIWDYKVTSVWSVILGDKPEWNNQQNGYAWLVRHVKKVPVVELKIIAILRDWNRRKAAEGGNYPPSPVHIIDIPLLGESEQDLYMEGRIKLHQNAQLERLKGGPLSECSPTERWQKAPRWAIKKGTAKRAVRVLDTEADANEYLATKGNGYHIELRPGENTKCVQNWCSVNKFCSWYQNEITKEKSNGN